MTIDRLRKIAEREAREHLRDFWRTNLIECYGDTLTEEEIDTALRMIREDARIPSPPRIIRTRDELAALDPSTAVTNGPLIHAAVTAAPFHEIGLFTLPAVVIATGDQVRAARQALDSAE